MDYDQDCPFAAAVSDEELERAAMSDKLSPAANFTLGACTGLSECPGVQ